mgnify:CR=1 FL=1
MKRNSNLITDEINRSYDNDDGKDNEKTNKSGITITTTTPVIIMEMVEAIIDNNNSNNENSDNSDDENYVNLQKLNSANLDFLQNDAEGSKLAQNESANKAKLNKNQILKQGNGKYAQLLS